MSDLTDHERAEIARLCGGERDPAWEIWWFPYDGVTIQRWLMPMIGDERRDLAMWESILMRGLTRAGVLMGMHYVLPAGGKPGTKGAHFVAVSPCSRAEGPTPIAAMIALAAAHVRAAAKEGGP